MKNLLRILGVMLATVFIGLSAVSCSDDKESEPSSNAGSITIINKSQYTLDSFQVNFTNDRGETITIEQKGTLKPNGTVLVDAPIGATYYYMSTVMFGDRYFSADYAINVRTQVLSDQIVGQWKKN